MDKESGTLDTLPVLQRGAEVAAGAFVLRCQMGGHGVKQLGLVQFQLLEMGFAPLSPAAPESGTGGALARPIHVLGLARIDFLSIRMAA